MSVIASTDRGLSIADPAVARLIEIDPALAIPLLDALLASADSELRSHGVEAAHRSPTRERVSLLGARLQDGLRSLLSEDGVGDARGLGLIGAIELVEDKEKHRPFSVDLNVGGRLTAACRDRGLISRNRSDSYLLAPPLVISAEQIDRIIEIMRESVRDTVAWARRQKPDV